MKAIKIDAENRKVEEIEVRGLADMQKAVGGFIQVEHYFEASDDVIYVDEEGLLKDPEYFFMLKNESEILAGNGLITGVNRRTGQEINCTITVEQISDKVFWMDTLTVAMYMAFMEIANS